MSALQSIAQTQIAAMEGRMENLRRRHESLVRLHRLLTDRQEEVLAAFSKDYETISQALLSAGLSAIIRTIVIQANRLDQVEGLKQKYAVQRMQPNSVCAKHAPFGLVAIIATSLDLQYPLDAILSPLVAATAAGNSIVVVLPKKKPRVMALLKELLSSAFQGGLGSTAVEESEAVMAFLQERASMQVSYDGRGALNLPSRAENAIIVDANIVSPSFYRTTKQSRKDLAKLRKVAQAIVDAQKYGDFLVLVSENIFESLKGTYMSIGGRKDQLVATTSLEHVIARSSKQSIGHLTCFTTRDFASFYATNIAARSVSIDSIPLDLIVGYCPNGTNIQLKHEQSDLTGFQLEPLWGTSLFVKTLPVVSVPHMDDNNLSLKKLSVIPMKRKHVAHLEFFPTGFVITFFPTFASLIGVTGFLGYRLAVGAYHLYTS